MSKKPQGKPAAEKPFNRPFEKLAKLKLPPAPGATPVPPASAPGSKPGGPGSKPPSSAPGSGKKTAAAAPEPESFADLLYGVKPLEPTRSRRSTSSPNNTPAAASAAQAAADADAAAVRAHLQALVSGTDARFEIHDDGDRMEGRRADVDPHTLRRLRRGEFLVDLRCDLHGLTSHEARARLEDVLARARQRGDRMLLLIHGKGHNSPGGRPVLRGEMAAWLSQGPASVHVAAFTTASEEDGGIGALYVLLRKPV